MSHKPANLPKPPHARSGTGRVSIRSLLRIGQRWRRKSRRQADRFVVVITQIHRGDRSVDARQEDTGRLERIPFSRLRAKYALLDKLDEGSKADNPGAGKGD